MYIPGSNTQCPNLYLGPSAKKTAFYLMAMMVFPCFIESLASLDHRPYHSIAFFLHLDLANISGSLHVMSSAQHAILCKDTFLELTTFHSLVTLKFLLNDHPMQEAMPSILKYESNPNRKK